VIELAHGRALVTGAGKRLGAEIAVALGRQGMRVAVHHSASADGAQRTAARVREVGGSAETFGADLTDRAAARDLVDRVLDRFGGLDLLVNSAANFDRIAYGDLDDDAWDRALALNLTAGFVLAQRATQALRVARGSIVFVTCTSATSPYKNHLPYVVSKGALRQLMRVMALELAPEVRVNAIAPGTVLPPADMPEADVERLAQRIPLRKTGEPEDVAGAVVFLAQSPFITGHEIVVDGGRTLLG
jgi:pteridine reductase